MIAFGTVLLVTFVVAWTGIAVLTRRQLAEQRRAEEALRRRSERIRSLYEVAGDATMSVEQQIEATLVLGCRWFGLDVGVVSRVEGGTYTLAHTHTEGEDQLRGRTLSLENTYTQIVLNVEGPLALHHVGESQYRHHPAYRAMRMDAYIGIPLVVHGRRFGTLEFAGIHPKTRAFDSDDRDIIQLLARWVATVFERKEAREELQRAKEAAEAANRTKSTFLATMSHELRTPLNVILGYTEMLADRDLDPQERDEFVDRIRTSGVDLMELIESTLAINKFEAGQDGVRVEPVSLPALWATLAEGCVRLPRCTGVTLEWGPVPPVTLVTDARKLGVVLRNLVGNALKFTLRGSVRVEADVADDRFALRVIDTGIGIRAEDRDAVFELFHQVDSSDSRRYCGVGLGLYVVRRFVTQLGGTVTVDSRPGEGSVFTVVLPTRDSVSGRGGGRGWGAGGPSDRRAAAGEAGAAKRGALAS